MTDILDLDALLPKPKEIKYDGQTIMVQPPTTKAILKLAVYGKKLQQQSELTDEQMDEAIAAATLGVKECIPELTKGSFNNAELMALIDILMGMSMSQDAKDMAENHITVDDAKKAQ